MNNIINTLNIGKRMFIFLALLIIVCFLKFPTNINGINVEVNKNFNDTKNIKLNLEYEYGFNEQLEPKIIFNNKCRFVIDTNMENINKIKILGLQGDKVKKIEFLDNGSKISKIGNIDYYFISEDDSLLGNIQFEEFFKNLNEKRNFTGNINLVLILLISYIVYAFYKNEVWIFKGLKKKFTNFFKEYYNVKFAKWFSISIFLKFLIMPFFVHADFLSMWRRVFNMILTNYYYPQSANGVLYFIHAVFLKLVQPFIPNIENMLYLFDYSKSTSGISEYLSFCSYDEIFRLLFVFKILFLIFDCAIGIMIYNFLKKNIGQKKAFITSLCWLFNPIIIYTSYIFGRFEVIPIFFLMLVFIFLKENKFYLSLLSMILLINSREFFLSLIPFYIISNTTIRKDGEGYLNYKKLFISSFSILLFFIIPYLIPKILNLKALFFSAVNITNGRTANIISVDFAGLSLFILVYVILCFYMLLDLNLNIYKKFAYSSMIFVGIYFCFLINPAPHYFSWLILPLVILLGGEFEKVFVFIIFNLIWFVFCLFNTDVGMFTLALASPISDVFYKLPNIPGLYKVYVSPIINISHPLLVRILRSINSASILSLMTKLLNSKKGEDAK